MICHTLIGPDKNVICGHSIMQHDGDESGMGGPEPCMVCGCQNFTREAAPEPYVAQLDSPAAGSGVPRDAMNTAESTYVQAGQPWQEELEAEAQVCPTCGSTAPERHPAVQYEGEVHICRDPWHSGTHAGREALSKAIGHAWADQAYGPLAEELAGSKTLDELATERKTINPGPGQNTRLQKWVDPAMFSAEKIIAEEGPQVHLLWMTPDPLAAIAGPSKMYKGETVRSLRDVTHAERKEFVQEIMKTKLQMPFEAVKFHFVIEGVTRAFTHQMVRQRTAAYAQRSDRFAVQEDGIPVALPPSLAGTTGVWRLHEQAAVKEAEAASGIEVDPQEEWVQHNLSERMARESDAERQRWAWDQAIDKIFASYSYLVANGTPQEDARGLLPTNLLTTIHYITDLRALLDHGGNRLCTQAQFEWRLVFSRIAQAIREYNPYAGLERQLENLGENMASLAVDHCYDTSERWQYETIAGLFRPVCYLTGKCEFKANFDRTCSIRDRVDKFAAWGVPSDKWADKPSERPGEPHLLPIFPAEWLLNPGAAR